MHQKKLKQVNLKIVHASIISWNNIFHALNKMYILKKALLVAF